jgi:hypothetical protein
MWDCPSQANSFYRFFNAKMHSRKFVMKVNFKRRFLNSSINWSRLSITLRICACNNAKLPRKNLVIRVNFRGSFETDWLCCSNNNFSHPAQDRRVQEDQMREPSQAQFSREREHSSGVFWYTHVDNKNDKRFKLSLISYPHVLTL